MRDCFPAASLARTQSLFMGLERCPLLRILDNLPIAIVRLREDNGQPFKTYERGYPVGRTEVMPLPASSFLACVAAC